MAVRTITTRLDLENAEYSAKLKNLNAELQLHKSELERVAAAHAGTANSLAALTEKESALKNELDVLNRRHTEQSAKLSESTQKQREYAEQVEQLRAKLETLKNTTGATAEQEKQLQKEIDDADKKFQQAGNSITFYQRLLNYTERDQHKVSDELARTRQYMDEAKNSTDGCASSIDGYGRAVKEAGDGSQDFGDKSKDAINALASVLAAAGVGKAVKEIADALRACVEASLEFETAMAGVRRTVGGTETELDAFASSFKNMALEIPSTTTELGKIAETAGQLGIARENVESFTEVMAMLSTTTDLTAENAATMLAQFANITGLTDYERLGSTVAQLGDATATTASKVVEMSQGMAAAASIAGMGETDILAIAAAVGSLGIEAQAGSTAMATLISNMSKSVEMGNDQLKQFAAVAGMSAQDFAAAWREDAAGALDIFIKGLNDTERNGRSAVVILDELGITNVRQTKAILGLANAGDLLTDTLAQANRAWEENTALQQKAEIMYNTTESKLKLMDNAFIGVKVAIGDALTPALGEMAEVGTGAFSWAAEFIQQNPWLVQAITGVASALTVLVGGVTALMVIEKLTPLIAKFNLVLAANPAVFVAAAIAGLITALTLFSASAEDSQSKVAALTKEMQESKKAYEETKAAIQDQKTNVLAMASSLETLAKVENKTAAQRAVMLEMVNQLNEAVPQLSLAYDEQADKLSMTTEALEEYIEAETRRQLQQEAVDRVVELRKEKANAEMELAKLEMEMQDIADKYETLGGESYASRYISEYKTAAVQADQLRDKIDELNGTTAAALQEVEDVGNAFGEYGTAADGAAEDTSALTDQTAAAGDALESTGEKTGQLAEKYLIAGSAADETGGKTAQLSEKLGGIEESLADVTAKYDEMRKAARASIDEQVGLFDKLDGTAEQSAEDLIDTLGSQVEYLSEYSENVRKVMEKGLDPEILKQLTDEFSEDNAKYLAALADASDDQVDRLNRLYGMVQDEKDKVADSLGDAQSGFSEAVSDLQQDLGSVLQGPQMYSDAFRSGQQTGQGIADGIRYEQGNAVKAAEELARAVQDAYNNIQDIHSPSRVMAKSGRNTVQGLIVGIDESEADLVRRVEELGRQAEKAMHLSIPQEPNLYEQTASQAAAVAGSLITVERAAQNENRGAEQPSVYDVKVEMDGAILARKIINHIRREEQLRGRGFVEGI